MIRARSERRRRAMTPSDAPAVSQTLECLEGASGYYQLQDELGKCVRKVSTYFYSYEFTGPIIPSKDQFKSTQKKIAVLIAELVWDAILFYKVKITSRRTNFRGPTMYNTAMKKLAAPYPLIRDTYMGYPNVPFSPAKGFILMARARQSMGRHSVTIEHCREEIEPTTWLEKEEGR